MQSETCDLCNTGRNAAFFVEYQLLVLGNPEYVAETGSVVRSWWGASCRECLVRVLGAPELIWLEAIPLSIGPNGRREYDLDWSKAAIRIGSRTPSEAMRRLLDACNPRPTVITPREALERLAVLRALATPVTGLHSPVGDDVCPSCLRPNALREVRVDDCEL